MSAAPAFFAFKTARVRQLAAETVERSHVHGAERV